MRRTGWGLVLLAALAVAAFLSPLASSAPDGLERVAERLGFAGRERKAPVVKAPLAEYQVSPIRDRRVSTSVAGIIGTLVVFGIAAGAGAALRRKRPS
jgi:cobalt/nickel transport protein